jgi:uncharacterized membrane protein YkvA (DUF1232 family)
MSTDRIRGQIESAWQDEARTRAFETLVRRQLVEAGAGEVPPESTTVAEILLAWRLQLENVPDLIDALRAAAADAGMAEAIEPVLATAESYFSDRDDVLPDSFGVLGLLDDMYLALSLIQQVSDRHREGTGRPLIEIDLTESVASVRPLFRGARLVTLDERIRRSLAAPELAACVERLSRMPRELDLTGASVAQ